MLPVVALLFSVGLQPGPTGAEAGCLPWSVLASQQGFSRQLQYHGSPPPTFATGKSTNTTLSIQNGNHPETARAQETRVSPFPLENLCQMAGTAHEGMEAINFWNRLGPLRLRPGVGIPLLMRVAQTDRAFDHLVRLPTVAGWEVAAHHFASGAFDRLVAKEQHPGPELGNLDAAARRWPDLAARWLSLQRFEDQDTPRFQTIAHALGAAEDPPNPRVAPEGSPVVPLILPRAGKGARTGRAIAAFLRIYSALANWDLVLSEMPEETASPEEMLILQSKGANIVAIVGPLVRKKLDPWLGSDPQSKPIIFRLRISDMGEFKSGVFGLGPRLRDQLRAHAAEQGGHLLEPLLIIGPPGPRIEQWRIAADQVLEVDKNPKSMGAMVLTYDPRDTDLSAFAEFVGQAAPETLILAVPHSDLDRVLRYLARAGVRARRKGKKPHANELHPVIIGPGSFGLDPSLKRRNRDYLDGLRIASDMPMIADWRKLPGVQQYVQAVGAYPPIAALRIAAALDRVQARYATKEETGAANAAGWISGETMLGHLELTDQALIFPLQVYRFFADRFSPLH